MKVRTLVAAGVLFLGMALMADAGGDNAKKLVGLWELAKADGGIPGSTLEFTKDGKLKIRAKAGDKEIAIDGTYKVKGDEVSVKLEFMGKTKMDTAKIKKLTGKELVLEKEDGKVDEYRRKKK